MTLSMLNWCWYVWGYFLHQHLVTLVGRLKKEKTLSVCLCRLGPFSRTKLSTANNHLFIYPLTSPCLRKSKKLENFSFFFKNRFLKNSWHDDCWILNAESEDLDWLTFKTTYFSFLRNFFFLNEDDDHFRIRTRIVWVEWQVRWPPDHLSLINPNLI